MIVSILVSIVFALGLVHPSNTVSKLIASHVLFRHGDRAPYGPTYPIEKSNASDWPNGYGQLTAAGMAQQYRLGQYLRRRYGPLLDSTYIPNEISIRSTNSSRTILSARWTLRGLYPTVTSDLIPVVTVPADQDTVFGVIYCPRIEQIMEEMNAADERAQQINQLYAPLFRQMENWTNITNIYLFDQGGVSDTIFIQYTYGTEPEWATKEVRDRLFTLTDLFFQITYSNKEIRRMQGGSVCSSLRMSTESQVYISGPIVRDILANVNKYINNKTYFYKVKMYSAHDSTLMSVLSFLGINYSRQPQYASAVFIDLYQQDDGNYTIKIDHRNVTDSHVTYSYQLPGCPSIYCPLDIFSKLFENQFPLNLVDECALKVTSITGNSQSNTGNRFFTIIILILVFFVK